MIVLILLAFVGMLLADDLWSLGALIVGVGLACSNIFSILFSFALEHSPKRSNEISALMIMGVSGGALVTPCMGWIADLYGQTASLMSLLLCVLYIGFVSLKTR